MKIGSPTRMFVKHVEEFIRKPDSYDLSKVTFITDPAAAELFRYTGELDLSGFTEESTHFPEAFFKGKSKKIILDGLSSWNPKIGSLLKYYSGEIQLHGLRSLSDEGAYQLSQSISKQIYIPNVCEISQEGLLMITRNKNVVIPEELLERVPNVIDLDVANRFLKNPSSVELTAAMELTDEGSAVLSNFHGLINLSGLRSISDQSCSLLASHRGSIILSFPGLEISTYGAIALLKHDPKIDKYENLVRLILNEKITKECAIWIFDKYKHEKNYENDLTCNAKSMCSESAQILANLDVNTLYLNCIELLSDSEALHLSRFKGKKLVLNSLKYLSPQGAKNIVNFKGEISLGQDSIFSPEVISVLADDKQARLKSMLHLDNIEKMRREKINRDEEVTRIREEIDKKYDNSIHFLKSLDTPYPLRPTDSKILNRFKDYFGINDNISKYKSKIIELAESRAICMDRSSLYNYLKTVDPGDISSNLISKIYSEQNYRVTHCFQCRSRLESCFFNECESCGWIRCSCGACGCNYRL